MAARQNVVIMTTTQIIALFFVFIFVYYTIAILVRRG